MMRLKRFAGRVTGSGTDPFRTARWKLTLVYCAILAAIVAILSASLFEFHTNDVDRIARRGARRAAATTAPEVILPGVPVGDEDAQSREARDAERPDFREYLERLGRSILFADLITLLAGGALSALLASRTLRPIRAAVESEKQFFANAAHDLRTPLAVMKSEAEVALRAPSITQENARRLLQSSVEEIDRMAVMVEQMFDLARGAPARASKLTPVDLAALCRSMAEKAMPRAAEHGLRLSHRGEAGARIRGDEVSLRRAVGNLLENAISYTPAGGSVELSVSRAHGAVTLAVEDTGIGVPDEDLPHVTEAFFRGDRARGVQAGGAGLGLTIVQDVVRAHGGTMTVARRPESGTAVTLRFPAA